MDEFRKHLYIYLAVGGGGTRLWPKSLEKSPKQFLKLFKGKTLFQITIDRILKIVDYDNIIVGTVSNNYKEIILKLAPRIKKENIIIEPMRKDTGPAYGLGAAKIYSIDKDAVVITSASDHLITQGRLYRKTMLAAAHLAYEKKVMLTVGIRPSSPHTGYGYIKKGKKVGVIDGKAFYKIDAFKEKPELKLAQKYIADGDYYWNASQYVYRADDFLGELNKTAPDIYKGLEKIMIYLGSKKEKSVIETEYKKMPKISVDYAVSEKTKNMQIMIADFSWTDVGDWKGVWENLHKDDLGNVIIDGEEDGGRVINIDTSDALIHTDGRLIAIIDVDNVVVVDTKEALLICSKSKAQNVKKIVEQLKSEGEKSLL